MISSTLNAFTKKNINEKKYFYFQIISLAEQCGIEVISSDVRGLNSLSGGRPHQGVCLDADRLRFTRLTSQDDYQMYVPGPPLHRENRENGLKIPCQGNTGNLEILQKHREFCLLKL